MGIGSHLSSLGLATLSQPAFKIPDEQRVQVKERLGSFPPPRRRAHTPYLVIPEPSWELARKGSRDPEPASHQTVITGTTAELGSARLGPRSGVRSGVMADSRGSAASASRKPLSPRGPRSPAIGAPQARLESRCPNPTTQTDLAWGSPSRYCLLTTAHPVHRTGNIQIRTRRPHPQSPLP